MADMATSLQWKGRLGFAVLAFLIVAIAFLPLNTAPSIWAGPDLLLAITLVWVVRRPDYVPVYAIAALFLLTDLLFHRPPGLWAALVVLLTEAMRNRTDDMRNTGFMMEWVTIASGIIAITFGFRLVLAIVSTPQAPLALTMIQMTATIAVYPLVVFAARGLFGISHTGPGQSDSKRQSL